MTRRDSAALAGSRVLVVEDEFIIALELQSILEEAGATVIGPACTLARALELAEHENLSAATLDLRLGRDSVAPVAQLLAARHIPFVFYTGQPKGDPVRRAWPDAQVLSKPAHPKEFTRAVASVLRKIH
jgi:CheY-like chemotaxis protein